MQLTLGEAVQTLVPKSVHHTPNKLLYCGVHLTNWRFTVRLELITVVI